MFTSDNPANESKDDEATEIDDDSQYDVNKETTDFVKHIENITTDTKLWSVTYTTYIIVLVCHNIIMSITQLDYIISIVVHL